MENKICKTKRQDIISCGLEKSINEFSKGSSLCKNCNKIASQKYRDDNQKYFQKYRDDNKTKINENYKEYYQDNKDKVQEKNKKWREENIDKHREYNKITARNDRRDNPHKYRWRYLLKNTLKTFGNKKEDKTVQLLGYSPIELKLFLESLDVNWIEFEIDHKIPITWFKPETPPNIVNDFRNLQLLKKGENSSKRNFYMDEVSEDFWYEVKKFIKEEYAQ